MPLVTSRGYNIQPNGFASALQGYQAGVGIMDQRNARQQRDIQQGLAGEQREWLAGGGLMGENAALEAGQFGDKFQKSVIDMLNLADKRTGQVDAQGMDKMARFAQYQSEKSKTGSGDPDFLVSQNQEIIDFARTLTNPAQVESVLGMIDDSPEDRAEMFSTIAGINLPAKDFAKYMETQKKAEAAASAPPKPMTASESANLELNKLKFEESKRQSAIKNQQKAVGGQQQLPPSLTKGLSTELAQKSNDAYMAAGGGSKGMNAFQKVVDSGTEQERRATSPAIINQSFPRASEAETVQLQAAMDAAKTTEAGLKSAGKVREKQRQTKKVQGFQRRAISLLEGILSNDELGDVIGSIEGAIDFRLQDSEAELIADIKEAGDILTGDNLDIMTGVLSETDIQIIRNLAGGGLDRKRTEKRFKSDVQAIIDKMKDTLVTTIDDRQAARSGNPVEGDIIFNKTTGERMKLINGQFQKVQ